MTQYRMLSTPMVHTPGLLAWAMNGYQFEEDREHMLRIMTSTFEAIPPGVMHNLLAGEIRFQIEDETVIFQAEKEPK